MRSIDDLFLQDYFRVLEAFVFMGLKCPSDRKILQEFRRFRHQYPKGLMQNPGGVLARQGFLTIEIAGCNWRTVTLHHGPLAGQSTLPCPHSVAPHRIIAADSTEVIRKLELNGAQRRIERMRRELVRRTEGVKKTVRSLKALRQEIATLEATLRERIESGEA